MYKEVSLSASLMCFDWLNVGSQLKELEELPLDYIHVDVIDGNFAPDFTMGSSIIEVIRNAVNIPFDFHLMVEEPSRLFNSFTIQKHDYFTIHQETSRNLHRDIVRVKRDLTKVGVALCPATPLESLEYILDDIDMLLLMTVNPGYKGQPLVPQVLKKVERAHTLIKENNLDIKIAVDGNVGFDNIPTMIANGANHLVLGTSGLFRKDMSLSVAMKKVTEAIDEGLKMKTNV
jgi:ribulose-phosphate 3-epimerase